MVVGGDCKQSALAVGYSAARFGQVVVAVYHICPWVMLQHVLPKWFR